MNTIKKMFGKVADLAKKVVWVGAIVGGISLVANATETTAGPTIEKAQLETVNINLKAVVDAITKVDPDWVKGLPRVKAGKSKGGELLKKKKASAAETDNLQPATQYVFFPGTSDTDCDAIDLNEHMGPSNPPTVEEGINPAGCEGEGQCCGKAYPAANVQYNPLSNRWEPTSEDGVEYFQKAP